MALLWVGHRAERGKVVRLGEVPAGCEPGTRLPRFPLIQDWWMMRSLRAMPYPLLCGPGADKPLRGKRIGGLKDTPFKVFEQALGAAF